MAHKPENIVERNKRISRLVAEGETARILKLREQMGVVPWEGASLTEDEKQDLFEAIIVDDVAVQEIVDRERQVWRLSPDRNPVRLRKEVQRRYKIALERGTIGGPSEFVPPAEEGTIDAV